MKDKITNKVWCEMVYDEADAYCTLNSINPKYITYEELEQCAISTAAALDFNEDDVRTQLEFYFDCEE